MGYRHGTNAAHLPTRACVILTHNRPQMLVDCVTAIGPQVDLIVVMDNASDPPTTLADLPPVDADIMVCNIPDQPPNLSRLWNQALTILKAIGDPRWVAFLCDDTTPPAGWMRAVVEGMQATGAAAGCSNPWGANHPPIVKTEPDGDIMGRMPGWAFVLDATRGLRADESMAWWWLDTSVDFDARKNGGMVMVGGYPVPNHRPGEYTNSKPELGEQAGRDGEAFAARWGWRPW